MKLQDIFFITIFVSGVCVVAGCLEKNYKKETSGDEINSSHGSHSLNRSKSLKNVNALKNSSGSISIDVKTLPTPMPVSSPTSTSSIISTIGNTVATSSIDKRITIQEKKRRFKKLVLPAINEVYNILDEQYHSTKKALVNGTKSSHIEKLKQYYNASTDEELLMALKPHPRSIALAQAATESAWGTSRFFKQANNAFGVWSFNVNEPRIAALQQRGNKTVWLKKYASIMDSVKDNYDILARGKAFKEFRKLRLTTDNPYELVKKLDRYSEKGDVYSEYLSSIISYNQFIEYDTKTNTNTSIFSD